MSRQDNPPQVARYRLDRFVPAVLVIPGTHTQVGGHLVDLSATDMRFVAPPTLASPPVAGSAALLAVALSDGNRAVDIDGVRQGVVVVSLRELPGAQVFRLLVEGTLEARLAHLLRRLVAETDASVDEDELPEFDPDVWAGWAAIAPGRPAG
jgi:hypothetical protein